MRRLRVACLQVSAGPDWKRNLARIRVLFDRAVRRGARLVALPECFAWRGQRRHMFEMSRTATPQVIQILRGWAKESRVALLLGSVLETSRSGRVHNTSILFSPSGTQVARYRKIHLFDVALKRLRFRESENIVPGRRPVVARALGLHMGMAVCYDLRFPELFRKLVSRGSEILFLPANFAHRTGVAHWEVLLRARAIENQAFVIAPAQAGIHPGIGMRTFGTSLIISPWGTVLARGKGRGEEVILADLDLAAQKKLRREFPVLKHRIFSSLD